MRGVTRIAVKTARLAVALSAAAMMSAPAEAAEDGKGFVLLGLNASLAGIVPPPGTYFANQGYSHTGNASIALNLCDASTSPFALPQPNARQPPATNAARLC